MAHAADVDTEAVRRYVRNLRERVMRVWEVPDGVPADQTVVVRFRLRADGSADALETVEGADPALSQSALEAFRRATPEPVPADASGLVGCWLRGSFRNPGLSKESVSAW
ncbi:MAG: TonB C-terminal domain-containing protein [Proteobacteria bacterium]|nr:TonB C-terminal domain-containing protein [Pseudomonadota bacterium]